jgi:(2R)-3-sulfolactate dehydrogenase (NADP+)
MMETVSTNELRKLLVEVLRAKGFSDANAQSLAAQTVLAEEMGQSNVGVAHLFDYLDGPASGRIDGQATPVVSRPAPSIISVDGCGGLPQAGFDAVFDDLVSTTRRQGVAVFLHRNATLCGSLSTFVGRLADADLVAMAATNGTPFLAGSGGTKPVYCTNPLAFAAPQQDRPPLIIDQSSSTTAYVNIRSAAEQGKKIPLGWALDPNGEPTTDPNAAMQGALQAFGGSRGANIALMVEILSAGLSGANWSLDAASFSNGDTCPATGMFVLAIDPEPTQQNFQRRIADQLKRLREKFSVHIPGLKKGETRINAQNRGLEIESGVLGKLQQLLKGSSAT